MRRSVVLGSVLVLVLSGCSGRQELKPPPDPPADLCAVIGIEKLRGLVPDVKPIPYSQLDDGIDDDLADVLCTANSDKPAEGQGWALLTVYLRRAHTDKWQTGRESVTDMLDRSCDYLAKGWAQGAAETYRDFTAGPVTRLDGIGDRACAITSRHTVVRSEVVDVHLYARRGIDYLDIKYSRSPADELTMPKDAADLARTVFAGT